MPFNIDNDFMLVKKNSKLKVGEQVQGTGN